MASNVDQRRKELTNYMYQGFPLDRVVEILSEKYNVKDKTIKRDWWNRKDWLADVFSIDIENSEMIVLDIIAQKKMLQRELFRLRRNTTQESVELGVLKELNKNVDDVFEICKDVGIVDKAKEEIELSGKIEVEKEEDLRDKFMEEINRVAKRLDDNEEGD